MYTRQIDALCEYQAAAENEVCVCVCVCVCLHMIHA